MKLKQFEGEKVIVVLQSGERREGVVTDFLSSDENNPPKDSIIMRLGNNSLTEIYAEEISTISLRSR